MGDMLHAAQCCVVTKAFERRIYSQLGLEFGTLVVKQESGRASRAATRGPNLYGALRHN